MHEHCRLETEEYDDFGVNAGGDGLCFLQQKGGLPKRRTSQTPPCGDLLDGAEEADEADGNEERK